MTSMKMTLIEFPVNIEEMIDNWESWAEENIGWCLLCDGPISSAQDLIPNTNTHTCAQGLKLLGTRPER